MISKIYLTKGHHGDLFGARLLDPHEALTNGDKFDQHSVAVFALRRGAGAEHEYIAEGNLPGTRLAVYSLAKFLELESPQKFENAQYVLDKKTIRSMQGHFSLATKKAAPEVEENQD